jgi:hypothetical protein
MAIKNIFQRNIPKITGMKPILIFLLLIYILSACTRNPLKINVSGIYVKVKIKHLDVDLLKLNQDQLKDAIPELKSRYGEFFDIFTYRMIAIGGTEQPDFHDLLYSFVSDTLVRNIEKQVAQKLDTVQLRKEFEDGFRHYRYYFPDKKIPAVYTCISGFNQSVVTSENLVGISLDKYLGSESHFYKKLGLPEYKRRNMHSEKIISDLFYAVAATEWPGNDRVNNLLNRMIEEGKAMYFVEAMLPNLDDTLKIGFTKKQLEFCLNNESKMWTYLAEHKLLYSNDRMSIKRFIDDGPYTSAFSEESPARTGIWLGWQIVRSYMKRHPETKLSDLMNNQDAQGILAQSGYQP